jgi:Zn-dependent peptidase ImmA (M78 family)
MLRDLSSRDEIVAASERLLRAARVRDELPTPVDRLLEVANLTRGPDDLFYDETIDQAPAHLREAVRKLRGKVHAALDRRKRTVYVDPEISLESRRRFRIAHEIGHAVLPSQNDPAHADDSRTLSWQSTVSKERDANQCGAELLFQRELFERMANEYEPSLGAVKELRDMFGASFQSTVRRFAEFHRAPVAAVVLGLSPISADPEVYKRDEVVCSPAWERIFERPDIWPKTLDAKTFPFVEGARVADVWGPQNWEGRWIDRDNRPVEIRGEVMSTSYKLLLLLWKPRRQFIRRRRELAAASPV